MMSNLVSVLLSLLYYSTHKSIFQHSSQNDAFEYKPDHVIPVMMGEEFDAVVHAGHIVDQSFVITCKWSQIACCWGHWEVWKIMSYLCVVYRIFQPA